MLQRFCKECVLSLYKCPAFLGNLVNKSLFGANIETTTPSKKVQQLAISWSKEPSFHQVPCRLGPPFCGECYSSRNQIFLGASPASTDRALWGSYRRASICLKGSKSLGCRHTGGARPFGGLSADPGGMCHQDQTVLGETTG